MFLFNLQLALDIIEQAHSGQEYPENHELVGITVSELRNHFPLPSDWTKATKCSAHRNVSCKGPMVAILYWKIETKVVLKIYQYLYLHTRVYIIISTCA